VWQEVGGAAAEKWGRMGERGGSRGEKKKPALGAGWYGG